jgi:hypothetical protein
MMRSGRATMALNWQKLRVEEEVTVRLFDVGVHVGDGMSVPGQEPCQTGGDEGLAGAALSAGYCDSHR